MVLACEGEIRYSRRGERVWVKGCTQAVSYQEVIRRDKDCAMENSARGDPAW